MGRGVVAGEVGDLGSLQTCVPCRPSFAARLPPQLCPRRPFCARPGLSSPADDDDDDDDDDDADDDDDDGADDDDDDGDAES